MAQVRTVLQHLLDGREALVLEVQRLTTAIEELDAVIAGVSATEAPPQDTDARRRAGTDTAHQVPSGSAARAKKGPARGAAARKATRKAPKSIRVHVLEMLGAEDREFGLAEIIDRIHGAGIQAHDDAVRSITIKLMKDGQVERVGRGQYRLARREAAGAGPSDHPPPLNLSQPWDRRS